MPFNRLTIPSIPPRAWKFIHRAEDLLADVHTMLRLPILEQKLSAELTFSVEIVLFAVISGISVTIYPRGGAKTDGDRFKELLSKFYPWNKVPPSGLKISEAADILYKAFRCPIVHDMGTFVPRRKDGRPYASSVKIEKFSDNDESRIEALERSLDHPGWMGPTIEYRPGEDLLLLRVDSLYWGVRKMIERLTEDSEIMKGAAKYLEDEYENLKEMGYVKRR